MHLAHGRPESDVLLLLDEFPKLGRFAAIEDSISILRGYGVRLWLLVQDLNQLQRVHPIWRTFLASATLQAFGRQQMQTARMLAASFAYEPVAVNDIGAVAYLRDGPMIDLLGLASNDVARAKGFDIDEPLSSAQMAAFADGAEVAAIYEDGFVGAVPKAWTRVGRFVVGACTSCAFPYVSYFATRGTARGRVAKY
ncbi:MAG: hypothetical protein EOO40_02125, partial [Deltaproteobacteria bacterium]